jgi:hypothetical protein
LPLHKVGKYLIPLLPFETDEQVYAIYEVHRRLFMNSSLVLSSAGMGS